MTPAQHLLMAGAMLGALMGTCRKLQANAEPMLGSATVGMK